MQEFLIENWKYVAIVISILGYLGYDKFAAMLAKLKPAKVDNDNMSAFTKIVSVDQIKTITANVDQGEVADLEAIMHLRDRAVAVKDKALLLEIKNVSGKFFDLHSIIDNSGK